ncbi:adhesion G protein-coupled receptor E5-like [Heptranchias perlo]|uniref:adhesion G protein-coupled receptor E5-like n=1 Tax=Heptranchias perlo TaxID=212740 RepID=UPI003559CC1C
MWELLDSFVQGDYICVTFCYNVWDLFAFTAQSSNCPDNNSLVFIAYHRLGEFVHIQYSLNDTVINLKLASNIVTVLWSNRLNCGTFSPITLTFPNDQSLAKEDVVCVHWHEKDEVGVWSSDGCDLLFINTSVIGCNCTQLSSFTVLKRIKGIENVIRVIDSISFVKAPSAGESKNKHYKDIAANLENMQNIVKNFTANIVNQGQVKISSGNIEIAVQAFHGHIPLDEKANFSITNVKVELSWEAIAGEDPSGIASITCIVLKGSESGMDADFLAGKYEQKPKLLSDVVTVTVSNQKTENLPSPIVLKFALSEKKELRQNALCVYWTSTTNETGWLSDGCTVILSKENQTICSCTHLTSFAVLMTQNPIPVAHEKNLQYITYIGITVSLVCLLLCLIVFFFCCSIQNIRITIHTHLCLSLFLAEILFVMDFQKSDNTIVCKAIAIALHYLFLACFAWMLLEGVQLYLMVVKVFHSRSLRRKYMYLFGYGSPLLIVIITAATNINAYGSETYCWITLKSGFIWAFMGPVCTIIGLNTIFFIITVWKLIDKFSMLSTDVPHFKKVRSFTCTAIAQLILLGCTWIFGTLYFTEETIVMSYIFTAINSFQGFFIFILHCLLNKQVRNEFMNTLRKISRRTTGDTGQGTSWKLGLPTLQDCSGVSKK